MKGLCGALFCVFAPAAALAAEPPDDPLEPEPMDAAEAGWERPAYQRVRIDWVERPLTTPRRTFEVGVDLAFGDRSPRGTAGEIIAGARYGLDRDQELGVVLWPLTIVKTGLQLGSPELFTVRRFLHSEWFELGGGIGVALPVGSAELSPGAVRIRPARGDWALWGELPMLLRLGPAIRVNLGLELALDFLDTVRPRSSLPVDVGVQLTRGLRLHARATTTLFEAGRLVVAIGAGAVYTIEGAQGAAVDLGILGWMPTVAAAGSEGIGAAQDWVAGVTARFFVAAEAGRLRGEEDL